MTGIGSANIISPIAYTPISFQKPSNETDKHYKSVSLRKVATNLHRSHPNFVISR